jgi:NAD-dependent DNA ligase
MTFMGNCIGAINMKNIYNETLSKINQRQRQIIVHSVLYYRFNTNIITDETFDKWARELVQLQKDFKELTKDSAFYMTMQDFDGTTGFHLADNVWGINKALYLLRTV